MKPSFHIKTIHGTNIFLHWSFILLAIWIVIVNFFEVSGIGGVAWGILLLFSLFISILVHEGGHLIVGNFFGVHPSSIILLPIGGVTNISGHPKKRWQEIVTLLAGPFANLVIAGLLMLFIHPYQAYWSETENIGVLDSDNFIFQLQVINLSLAVLNLIPAFPMDAGKIMRILLSIKMPVARATRLENIISIIIAMGLMIFGIIDINVYIILFGLFIAFTANIVKQSESDSPKAPNKRQGYQGFQKINVNA